MGEARQGKLWGGPEAPWGKGGLRKGREGWGESSAGSAPPSSVPCRGPAFTLLPHQHTLTPSLPDGGWHPPRQTVLRWPASHRHPSEVPRGWKRSLESSAGAGDVQTPVLMTQKHLLLTSCCFQCDALSEEFNSRRKESNPPAQEPNHGERWAPCSRGPGVRAHGGAAIRSVTLHHRTTLASA